MIHLIYSDETGWCEAAEPSDATHTAFPRPVEPRYALIVQPEVAMAALRSGRRPRWWGRALKEVLREFDRRGWKIMAPAPGSEASTDPGEHS